MLTLLTAVSGLCCAQNQAKKLILKNATIIDGDANVKPRIGSIIIENGLIKGVYDQLSKVKEKDADVVDCSGKFIVPGMMDSHVHFATGNLSNIKKARLNTDSILLNFVRHGVTTVRDMTGNAPYLAHYKNDIKAGKVIGPDIYYAAQFAGPAYFKLITKFKKDDQDVGNTPWYKTISKQENIKQAVEDAKNAGVTGIKVYSDLNKTLINGITKEAHKQGLMVWAHAAVFPAKPIDVALAGVNSMSHASDLIFQSIKGDTLNSSVAWAKLNKGLKIDSAACDQLLLEMKKRNIYLDPTVFLSENNKLKNAVLITKRAHELGVNMVTGTDWFYPTKNENLPLMYEMKLLAEKCGMSNLEVLQAATMNGAKVTGLSDRGVVRKGKKANLLILNQDPRLTLETLFSPEKVIKDGDVIHE